MLGELINTAHEREQEKQLLPLWLVYYAVKTMKHEPAMPFEEFISDAKAEATGEPRAQTTAKQPTAEEIIKEFAPIIAADELRRAKRGNKGNP